MSRMRLAVLTSRTIPHIEADVEQTVRSVAALAARPAVEVLLSFVSANRTRGSEAVRVEVERYYGLDFRRARLWPTAPRIDVSKIVGGISCERATGPQLLSDAVCARVVTTALRGWAVDVAISRRWLLAIAASRLKIPAFFETHSPSHAGVLARLATAFGWSGIVTHSDRTRRAFLDAGCPPRAVRTIRNGFDPSLLERSGDRQVARQRLGIGATDVVVCYAGRLNEGKGPLSLVRAAARMPEIRVVLVGAVNERERDRVLTLARTCGATNVSVAMRVEPADVAQYLVAADALLLAPTASPLASGRTVLPLKTYLYMGAARQIVGPATEDICEVMEHGRNAWLVPPDDPDATVAGVRRLMSDREFANRLAQEASRDAQNYTWRARAEQLDSFIRERCQAR